MPDRDAFEHLKALRPSSRRAVGGARSATGELPAESARLAELLGAACERNRFGEYLAVRQWFPEPSPWEPDARALHLLASPVPAPSPSALGEIADLERWLFLDTETTGLAGGTGTYAFLVGVAWWDASGLQVEQFFMRDHTEEHAVLLALAERLVERRVLVTFNGKCFDWPLLETRYRLTRQLAPRAPRAHLDLLHPARQLWRLRLGSVRLPQLERQILGWDRGADVSSELIPQIYFEFLRGGSSDALVPVFRHNQMDLRGLAMLAGRIAALLADSEVAEADPLDLYGLGRLLHRRGEPARARAVSERALAAGLPAGVARAARRALALQAKRDRDFCRANLLWEQLLHPADDPAPQKPNALGSIQPTGSVGDAAVNSVLEAYEQLAMFYEHSAHSPERAAELSREALANLRGARRAGNIDPGRARHWQARLEHRLARLERRGRGQREFREPRPLGELRN